MNWAASLLIPALSLPIAAALAFAQTLPGPLAALVRLAPLVVFVGGALLGLVLQRGRLVLGLVLFALADRALVHLGRRGVFNAVALLLPVNLGVIVWLPEVSLLTNRGAAHFGAILLQAVVVVILQHPKFAPAASAVTPSAWTPIPDLAVMAFVVALGLTLVRWLLDGFPLASGAAWALVASLLALDGASAGKPVTVYFVTAGLMLLIGGTRETPHAVYLDDVTGLPTRFAFNNALRRLPQRYALARVEIDEFESLRAEHGADASRRMQRLVARALTKTGGSAFACDANAFAVVFRRTSAATAGRHLEGVRRAVEAATLEVRVSEPPRKDQPGRPPTIERTVSVTISAGVAQPDARGADPHEVLRAAEAALERAKQAGLNCVSE